MFHQKFFGHNFRVILTKVRRYCQQKQIIEFPNYVPVVVAIFNFAPFFTEQLCYNDNAQLRLTEISYRNSSLSCVVIMFSYRNSMQSNRVQQSPKRRFFIFIAYYPTTSHPYAISYQRQKMPISQCSGSHRVNRKNRPPIYS